MYVGYHDTRLATKRISALRGRSRFTPWGVSKQGDITQRDITQPSRAGVLVKYNTRSVTHYHTEREAGLW